MVYKHTSTTQYVTKSWNAYAKQAMDTITTVIQLVSFLTLRYVCLERVEYLDVTNCNLLTPTNPNLARGNQDNLLVKKERMESIKCVDSCKGNHNASFRGLAFCDSSRMGPNIKNLYNEIFSKCNQTHHWNETEDSLSMI